MSWLLALACTCRPPVDPALGEGAWRLRGGGAEGILEIEGGRCTLGLWGPTWASAGGAEGAACEVEDRAPGESWLFFPFEGGAGEGTAALRLDPDGDEVVFPLGARDGELELRMTRTAGGMGREERAALAEAALERVAQEAARWLEGAFRLEDQGALVGEVWFVSDAPTALALYDVHWMTDGVVQAQQIFDGPDRVLIFPVMPALDGGEGRLRINALTREVIVPMGRAPSPLDRRLRLEPGGVSPEEARGAIEAADAAALERERALLSRVAPALAEALEAAGCAKAPAALREEWARWLVGYQVMPEPSAPGEPCVLDLEPDPPQHTRRLAVRASSAGILGEAPRE